MLSERGIKLVSGVLMADKTFTITDRSGKRWTINYDAVDSAIVANYRWHLRRGVNYLAVCSNRKTNGEKLDRRVYLRRLVAIVPFDEKTAAKMRVEHVFGNGLDCRKRFLRVIVNE